jgi:ligand-binding sensor domain-containing protein/signal transduction histidine kinase
MSKIGQLFLLILFTTYHSNAQEYKFWNLSVKQGLSNNNVTCILQDSQGFMWFGTADGLNRYDGYGFKVYRKNIADTTGLPVNHINALCEDGNHNLWVATPNGLCKYNRTLDKFEILKEFDNSLIISLYADNKNNVWIVGDDYVSMLNQKTQQWEHFYHLFPKGHYFGAIAQTSEEDFWIGSNEAGLYHFHYPTRKVEVFEHDPQNGNSLTHNSIYRLGFDGKHTLWIATFQRGVSKYDLQSKQFTNFEAIPNQKNALLSNTVRDICKDGRYILFGLENGGINSYDTQTGHFTYFVHDNNNPNSLADNSVWAIYKDRQERIWVGTFSGGISVADKYQHKFGELQIDLPNKTVNAVLQDSKNRLWIGTEKGVVLKDKDKIAHYEHEATNPKSLSANPVLRVYEDSLHQIWLGTWSGGVNLYDEKAKTFKRFIHPQKNIVGNINPNNVFAITEVSSQRILTGSFGGLNTLNVKENIWSKFVDDSLVIYINDVLRDKNQNWWVASERGLFYFEPKTKKLFHYTYNPQDTNSIISNAVYCILEDSRQRLWLGTREGLCLMTKQGKFKRYTTANGLPNDFINAIVEDAKGYFWITTNNGLSKFDEKTQSFQNYSESDGLLSKQFKKNAIAKTKEGYILTGGSNGINIFHPDSVKKNPFLPSVVLTDFKVFNKSVAIHAPDSILKQHISQTKEIILSHQYSVFSFDFVALDFTQSEKNQYAYRLEPFEKEWNYVGNQRNATYTNLDAGTYTFRVKASNNDGLWNEEGTSIKIVILPPWWATLWFRLLVICLIIGSTVGYYKWRTNFLKKRNQELERKVTQRTTDLKEANEELKQQKEELRQQSNSLEEANYLKDKLFSIIGHDLRSPLNTLKGIVMLLQQDNISPEEFKELAVKLTKNVSYASDLLNNLLYWAKNQMQLGAIVYEEVFDVKEIAQSQIELFEKHARDKNIILENLIPNGTLVMADKNMIDLVLRNLVSNAIKFCKSEDNIQIDSKILQQFVQVSVIDSGIGIAPENQKRLFDNYSFSTQGTANEKGTGLGLVLCKEFVEKNGGKIWVESEIGKGSIFHFTLPMNKVY